MPTLLHAIPYVPETIAHLPPYSLEALKAVWREACTPLYHCRCTICERAMARLKEANDALVAASQPVESHPRPPKSTPAPDPWVVQLGTDEAAELGNDEVAEFGSDGVVELSDDGVLRLSDDDAGPGAESVVSVVYEGEEAREYYPDKGAKKRTVERNESPTSCPERDAYWARVEEEDGPGAYAEELKTLDQMARGDFGSEEYDGDEYDEEEDYDEEDDVREGVGDGAKYGLTPTSWVAGRKRSVDELDGEDVARMADTGRGSTPPKRQRVGEHAREVSVEYTSVRLVKRRSEELDAGDDESDTGDAESRHSAGSATKRARVDAAESPPDTSTGTGSTPGSESIASGYDSPVALVGALEK
ncbi:hypothetical protein B0H10DRAFT_2083156 [Mycena sp. CBHHK59/15]|nr:hypothetical protein B0H10DRAFT_2083156 [Mycena sp. CBHHK59/15]